ncbi:MAG: glycosyltransferase [Candidatus Competibacteraceae bacterium]
MAKKSLARDNSNAIPSIKKAAKADTRKPDETAGGVAKSTAEAKPTVSRVEKTPAPVTPAVSTTHKTTVPPKRGEDRKTRGVAATGPVGKAASAGTSATEEPVLSTTPDAEVVAEAAAVASSLTAEAMTVTPVDTAASRAVDAAEVPVGEAVTAPSIKVTTVELAETEAPVGEAVTEEATTIGLVVEEALPPVIAEVPPLPVIEEAPPALEHVPMQEEPRYEPPGYIRPPLENKYLNKESLRDRLWLRKEFKPIISYVGRLDFQKGVHLIRHGVFYALQQGAQFVLLGTSPEPRINEEFWHLKNQLNDNPDCHLEIGFNEELSHLIYAGSDMVIMPSLYEPCGLTQMIALKYGTVPIVRAVGGLVDTVFDRDYSDRPWEQRNGYVFHQPDAAGLESAMLRAIGLWYSYPDEFRRLMINGMKSDYSWNYPGQHYLNIYEYIRAK